MAVDAHVLCNHNCRKTISLSKRSTWQLIEPFSDSIKSFLEFLCLYSTSLVSLFIATVLLALYGKLFY